MATGPSNTGVNVNNSKPVFVQQLALNAEAVSDKWSALGDRLMPIGQYAWGQNKQAQRNSASGLIAATLHRATAQKRLHKRSSMPVRRLGLPGCFVHRSWRMLRRGINHIDLKRI